jgi:hypothetical protein
MKEELKENKDHGDLFCFPGYFGNSIRVTFLYFLGLHRLRPVQLKEISNQLLAAALNDDRPMPERIKAVNRWTLLPSLSYSEIVNFIIKNIIADRKVQKIEKFN